MQVRGLSTSEKSGKYPFSTLLLIWQAPWPRQNWPPCAPCRHPASCSAGRGPGGLRLTERTGQPHPAAWPPSCGTCDSTPRGSPHRSAPGRSADVFEESLTRPIGLAKMVTSVRSCGSAIRRRKISTTFVGTASMVIARWRIAMPTMPLSTDLAPRLAGAESHDLAHLAVVVTEPRVGWTWTVQGSR